jgi:peptidoglycan/LPS O-acetylase OafA/YrhL
MLSRIQIGTEKYPALTGIRALGAAIVFFDHFPLQPNSHLVLNVMAFFYSLSGFLIVRVYYQQAALERGWLTKYFLNRFARIYPVYFLLLTLAVFLHHDFRPLVLLSNYSLTHALFRGSTILIQPSWSLTVEECFYGLAPLYMVLSKRRGFPAALALGFLMLLGALAISAMNLRFLATPRFVFSTTFFGHFLEFFAGFFLALAVMRLEQANRASARGSRYTLAGLAGVVVLIGALSQVYRRSPENFVAIVLINNFLIPIPIALLYWGLIRENTLLSRLLSTPLAGLLGRSSYAFYVLHILVVEYLGAPLAAAHSQYRSSLSVVTFLVTWLLSVLIFVLYEEPLNLFIRRRFKSKTEQVGMQATLFQVSLPEVSAPRASMHVDRAVKANG